MKKCIFRSTALILAMFMLFSLFACKPQGSSPSETVPDITTEAPDPSVAVKATYDEGDEKKLSEYLNEEPEFSEDATEEEIAEYEKYENIMVAERDAKMLERAKQYLENKDEVVFFAVGIGHFFSETGLIEGLREAGYTVELVEYE